MALVNHTLKELLTSISSVLIQTSLEIRYIFLHAFNITVVQCWSDTGVSEHRCCPKTGLLNHIPQLPLLVANSFQRYIRSSQFLQIFFWKYVKLTEQQRKAWATTYGLAPRRFMKHIYLGLLKPRRRISMSIYLSIYCLFINKILTQQKRIKFRAEQASNNDWLIDWFVYWLH